ncbi:FAD-dependent oxidoreductase [Methylotuvimicrobium sp.]|uniref:FAD-dependent oxidoreductase n=1 Tax=Methylotuvimicrobium sp. TaxID=2822413 RepID=UPI003D64E2DE
MKPGARVVLMGAEFIGCIILEMLVKSGAKLIIIEMGEGMMNEKGGVLIKQWCLEKGVMIHCCTTITAFEADQSGLRVKLDTGEMLIADFVVSRPALMPISIFCKAAA